MSLVSAFSGAGGVVLFADSQETVQGYAKKSISKIECRIGKFFSLGLAGAGNGPHVDALISSIVGNLYQITSDGPGAIEDTVKAAVLDYYQKHIWPRATDAPEVEIILVTNSFVGLANIFHVCDGTVNWIPGGNVSIGIGRYLADYLMSKLDDFGQDEPEMLAVATYVLREVKKNVDGVGLDSNIHLFLRDGSVDVWEQSQLVELEALMDRYDEVMNTVFDSSFDLSKFRSKTGGLAAEIDSMSAEFRRVWENRRQNTIDMVRRSIDRRKRLRG